MNNDRLSQVEVTKMYTPDQINVKVGDRFIHDGKKGAVMSDPSFHRMYDFGNNESLSESAMYFPKGVNIFIDNTLEVREKKTPKSIKEYATVRFAYDHIDWYTDTVSVLYLNKLP